MGVCCVLRSLVSCMIAMCMLCVFMNCVSSCFLVLIPSMLSCSMFMSCFRCVLFAGACV